MTWGSGEWRPADTVSGGDPAVRVGGGNTVVVVTGSGRQSRRGGVLSGRKLVGPLARLAWVSILALPRLSEIWGT